MFIAAALANVLLASAVLARPSLKERNARRAVGSHQSRPKNPILDSNGDVQRNTKTNAETSTNWAGAVYDSGSETYKSVSATFTVPKPSNGAGGGSQSASAWVGIDGDTCENAILQTGVDFNYDGGEVSYDAWYEWYPDYAYDFDGISFEAGDEVSLLVTATTPFSGVATIENLTTGQKVTQDIISLFSLCEENAEWIVEDFEEGDSLVPLANFGTVVFENAVATTGSGTVGPTLATLIDIVQNGKTLATSEVGLTTVTVSYV